MPGQLAPTATSTPAPIVAGASTGRPTRDLEEVTAILPVAEGEDAPPSFMLAGLQAEVTGTYPDADDDDDV